jgi:hypothetical protein
VDDNRFDVNDLSLRNNLAIEDAGMSPPKMRSAKKNCRLLLERYSLRGVSLPQSSTDDNVMNKFVG